MENRDYTKAPALYKLAADQGLPAAQYNYAKALKNGRGIEMDRFTAYVWFVIALDAGYSPAEAGLAELDGGGFLSTSQISDAKQKARELERTVRHRRFNVSAVRAALDLWLLAFSYSPSASTLNLTVSPKS